MNFKKIMHRSRKNSRNIMSSTEKWRNNGRRISRRVNDIADISSNESMEKINEIEDWLEDFFVRKNSDVDKQDEDVEVKLSRKQTLILSTLVPDEILLMEKYDAIEPKRFVGVLLMADVSGYTALSEKYNTGKGGTYKLTFTLNTYLGSLIEVIYNHGGDIIKFAGDAFLALWKTDKRTFLCHTIHTAIASALIIQHSYGSFETDVKVNLKVKLAISAGNLLFAPIGSGIDMNYVITGLPVIEAKKAESLCASGEVKLTPTAWGHCYSRNYDHEIGEDGHVTIKSILYDPHENDVTKPFLGFGAMLRQVNKPYVTLEDLPDFLLESEKNISNADLNKRNELLSLRKTILLGEEKNIGSEIRKFMIRPVLTQIDAHQPLEYLTEMRQVSILFLTLKPRECPFPQLITIVNNTYQITCDIVYKSMGCVNKIILFDKDVMILVIFGLRGFKHESEAQAALKCAYSVKKSVAALDGVRDVSIGVTTGQVYCGVVGHPLRREFTVIGTVVNKAARFMCSFRNKITCDEATFVNSKMSSNGFTLQPPTDLKGIINPGKIYEYTEEIRVKQLFDIEIVPPLLDREDEMDYYQNWINDRKLAYRDFDMLLLLGESRSGKTRLLEWMVRYAKNEGLKICYISLTSIHSATPYLALSQIIDQILELKEPNEGFVKEEKIVQLLKYYSEDLCYLNKIIKVSFAYHEGIHSTNEQIKKQKTKSIFKQIIMSLPNTYVIFLDDLQNLDPFSWEFIGLMVQNTKIYTVITITRGKFDSMHSWFYNVFTNSSAAKIVLDTMSPIWISPLACQILDVVGVSKDLCDALIKKCKGMPGLVETFILHLFSNGALELKKILLNELNSYDQKLIFPDRRLLRPVAMNAKHQSALDMNMEENQSEEISICLVTKKSELNADMNTLHLDALIMIQLDSLTPYQQLLLKIASVIGNVMSRDLLENIMYENDAMTTARAIKRLFTMQILSCANTKQDRRLTAYRASMVSSASNKTNITCECNFEYNSENDESLPKYAFCKLMKFRSRNSRNTFYELLPLNQKKEFHSRIVTYLENNKQKCSDCGGTVMFVQSEISLNIRSTYSNDNLTYNMVQFKESDEDFEIESIDTAQYYPTSEKQDYNEIKRTKSEPQETLKTIDIKKTKSELFPKQKLTECLNTPVKIKLKNNRVKMLNILLEDDENHDEQIKHPIFEMFRAVIEANKTEDWRELGIIDSEDNTIQDRKEDKQFCIKLENGISQTNFSKCTCAELNIIIYDQLIHHAEEAELKLKRVEFLITYSYLNLIPNNAEHAINKLEEAENICLDKSNHMIDSFNRNRFLGKIHSLKASSLLMSENFTCAQKEIEKAFKIYHINLDRVAALFNFNSTIAAIKFKRVKHRQHGTTMKTDSIFCLNVATMLYSTIGDEKYSRIAALRAFYLVQKVQCNIVDICDTLSNVIQLEINRKPTDATANIESIASEILRNLSNPVQAQELYVIGNFFMTVFRARTARAHLIPAVRIGYRALVVSCFLYATKISVDIIPDLFYLLLARGRIEEAVGVVKLLLKLDEPCLDCETWYYALCMDMILDAGFQLECPYEISHFAEYSLHKTEKRTASRRRLIVGLWTYWLRADSERKSKRFEAEALNWLAPENDDNSLKTLLSAMRLAEGMLESLARKVDDLRKVVDLMELRSLADKELSRLEKDVLYLRAVYPRLVLLKANSLLLSGRQTAATGRFMQALDESRRINNKLEEALVRATMSNSRCWMESVKTGVFLHWSDADKNTQKWHLFLYKIASRRLP